MALSVVWINFNGLALLREHFASVVDAVRREDVVAEFIVVDNASRDGSMEWLEKNFPQVRLLRQERNLFFAPAANLGVREARNRLILLLNPDVRVEQLRLAEVLARFQSDDYLFALSPRLVDPRDGCQEKLFAFRMSRGTVDIVPPSDFPPEVERPIPYGTGGALFLRRDVFLQLGGFREIFAPFYWEDIDLGVRGWEAGWRTVYFPASSFHHFHSTLISAWNENRYIRLIYERNRLVFMHLNLGGARWRLNYSLWLPLRLARSLFTDRVFWDGWLDFRRLRRGIAAAWRGRRDGIIGYFLLEKSWKP